MKNLILTALLLLAAGAAVYLISSLRTVGRQVIGKGDIPHGTYDITVWTSDARGTAYVLIDPSGNIPVTVSRGLGRIDAQGLRHSRDYLNSMQRMPQIYRIISRKNGQALAFVLAAERLEIEAGYNILKRNGILSIRDPEDSHHRRMHEGH